MSGEITHRDEDGVMIQIVSAERLRQILDADGENYTPPDDFGPDDEWDVGECGECQLEHQKPQEHVFSSNLGTLSNEKKD